MTRKPAIGVGVFLRRRKTLTIVAATAASVLALSAGAASAQGWNPNNQRPAADARYDRGGEWRDSRGGWMNINQRRLALQRAIGLEGRPASIATFPEGSPGGRNAARRC